MLLFLLLANICHLLSKLLISCGNLTAFVVGENAFSLCGSFYCTPSLAQAIKMKKYMQEGKLTDGVISSIMEEEKPNQREKPAFHDERITKLIPKSVPKGKESDFVVKALEFYNRHLQRSKAQER